MCFLENGNDNDDIVDVRINMDECIEEVSLKDLTIKGKFFSYFLKPLTHLLEIKGLMFIELVLYDTQKFLETNANRIKIERN